MRRGHLQAGLLLCLLCVLCSDSPLAAQPSPRSQTLLFLGHEKPARRVAIAPDGRYAVSASGLHGDRSLRLWDYATGKELRRFQLRTAYPVTDMQGVPGNEAEQWMCVSFSADGSKLLSTSVGGLVVLWDVATAAEVQRFMHQARTTRAALSPDGTAVAVGCTTGWVYLWSAATGTKVKQWQAHTNQVRVLAYLPDGKQLLTGSVDLSVKLWDIATTRQLYSCEGHTRPVEGLAVSRDGKWFLSGADEIRQWDAATGKLLRSIPTPKTGITGLALAPNQKLVASSAYGGAVRIWDLATGAPVHRFQHPVGWAYDVAYAPDGQSVLSCSGQSNAKAQRSMEDCALHRWSLVSTQPVATQPTGAQPPRPQAMLFLGHTRPATRVAISPDGRHAVSTSGFNGDKTIRYWDYATGRELRKFELKNPYPATDIAPGPGTESEQWTSVTFAPDGTKFVTTSFGGLVVIWDVVTSQEVLRLMHRKRPSRAAYAPDGKTLAVCTADGAIQLWNALDGTALKKWQAHSEPIRVLQFLPDGKRLLSGGYDRTVKLWEVETGKELYTCAGHGNWVEGLALAKNGKWFLTGADDIRQWDAETGKLLRTFATPKMYGVTGLSLSPSQKLVASCAYDGSVRIWHIETATEVQRCDHPFGWAFDVAFSPDGQSVLSSGGGFGDSRTQVTVQQCALHRWKFATAMPPPLQLAGHNGPVSALAVTNDGRYVLSASGAPKGDKSVLLWDTATGRLVRRLECDAGLPFFGGADDEPGQHLTLAVTPSGLAFSGTSNGIGILWNLDAGKEVRRFQGHRGAIHAVVFAPDEKTVITASGDKTIRVWDALSAQELKKYTEHTAAVRGLALTRDGQRLLSASADGTVKVWDLKTDKCVQTLAAPNKAAQLRVAVARDGQRAFSAGEHVYQWALVKGELQRTLEHPNKLAVAVALSPDEQHLASADKGGRVYLWEVETGELVTGTADHKHWIQDVVFTPTGRYLLSAGGGETTEKGVQPGTDFAIRRWDLALIATR